MLARKGISMSLVLGFSFPEEAIIICDSRIGTYDRYKNTIGKSDDLRKNIFIGRSSK